MFGHQDDHKRDDHQPIQDLLSAPALDGVLSETTDTTGANQPQDFNPALPPSDSVISPVAAADPAEEPAPRLGGGLADSVPAPNLDLDADTPTDSAPVSSALASDLLDIKQQALNQLSPLVDHLEQSPEEKFHTTMMMIQANDNQELVKVAYEAAQAITDEKTRAKALLDIINEINYFTQHNA